MKNGNVWMWIAGIIVAIGLPIITSKIMDHESRLSRTEANMVNIDKKLDRLISMTERHLLKD